MIKGLGTDLVDVIRMEQKTGKVNFLKTAFTDREIAYCIGKKNSAQHFAVRFAAKEAYMKAIGSGWSKESDFKEIEIINDKNGKPGLQLIGTTSSFFHESGCKNIFVSLSHTKTMAMATVIITT